MMLDGILTTILSILSVYRLSMLIAYDDGPLHILSAIREYAGRKASEGGLWWLSLAELLHCPFCLGVWFALAVYILLSTGSQFANAIIFIIGIAGGQAFLERCTNGSYDTD